MKDNGDTTRNNANSMAIAMIETILVNEEIALSICKHHGIEEKLGMGDHCPWACLDVPFSMTIETITRRMLKDLSSIEFAKLQV